MSNDGGQAFPRPNVPGMTLLDWFAGQALAGLLANSETAWITKHAAVTAYNYANAMLAERESRK
jgi:hypothetical protein